MEINNKFRDQCNDGREEIIEWYKNKLLKATNINTSPDELKVLDSLLMRFWQMNWLQNSTKYQNICEALEEKQISLLKGMRYDYKKVLELKQNLDFNNENWRIDNALRDIKFAIETMSKHSYYVKEIQEIETLLQGYSTIDFKNKFLIYPEDLEDFILGKIAYLGFRNINGKIIYKKKFTNLKFTLITEDIISKIEIIKNKENKECESNN